MKRMVVVSLLALLLAACGGGKKLHPYQEPVSKRPDPDVTVPEDLRKAWEIDVGGGDRIGYTHIRPAVVDEALFFADPDGDVVRVDAKTGETQWRSKIDDIIAGVGSDGIAVAVGLANGNVAALDAETGELLWEKDLDLEVSAPPVLADSVVAVRTSGGAVIGLDTTNGDELWRYRRSVPGLTLRGDAPMVAVANGLLTGFANGKLVASDLQSGRVFWEKVVSLARGRNEIERLNDVDAPPLVAEREIYVSTYRGGVLALQAEDARDLWLAEVSTRRPMEADLRQLYITNELGSVIAINRENGETSWRQDALQGHGVSGPVLFDVFLAIGTLDGVVYLLDPDDGTLAGKYAAVDGPVIALRSNGDRLLVATSEGEVASLSFGF